MTEVSQPDYGVYRQKFEQPCWSCGYRMDSATEVTGRGKPKAGDFSLCFRCGDFAVFTGQALLRRQPTDEELAEFLADPRALAMQQRIRTERPLGR